MSAVRDRRILPLPEDVVAQIKSSTAIVSLTGVVLELLKNALDAGAGKVEATVDFARGGCSVEDNGLGVAPAEFREDGGLGKLHCTSKYFSEHVCLGRNGTFLASLGALSLLTIVSRHHEHRSHNLLTLHHSKAIDRQLPAPAQHEIYGKHGTRVVVRNLFGNLPVRVKQRGIAAEQKTEHVRMWDTLRREVTSLLLSWREPVTLRIRGADGKTSVSFSAPTCIDKETRARPSGLRNVLSVLTQASYILHDEWSSWVPVSASTSTVSIKGAISLDPAPTKRVQFISLGVNPVNSDTGHNELFDEVNRIFALSSFGTVEDDVDHSEDEKTRRQRDKRFKSDGYTNRQLKARKGVDRYPMFHLRLILKHESNNTRAENLFSETTANLNSVMEILNAMVTEWLAVHHFRPRKPPGKRIGTPLSSTSTTTAEGNNTSQPSVQGHGFRGSPRLLMTCTPDDTSTDAHPRKNEKSKSGFSGKALDRSQHLAFADWSRIKSGNANFLDDIGKNRISRPLTGGTNPSSTMRHQLTPRTATFDVTPVLAGSLGGVVQPGCLAEEEKSQSEDKYDEAIPWTDPSTKQTYLLNARTGCVLPRCPTRPHTDPSPNVSGSTLNDFKKRLRLPQKTIRPNSEPGTWLGGILREWDNSVFKPAQTSIQQASLHDEQQGRNCQHVNHPGVGYWSDDAFRGLTTSCTSKLSKIGLENAHVMAQLDRKFILTKMKSFKDIGACPVGERSVLVLIDQHAADERIRVEELFAELCAPLPKGVQTYRSNLGHQSNVAFTTLDKPIQFTISVQEHEQFITHAPRFANWGILFDIVTPTAAPARSQPILSVTDLPTVVSERCKADPQVLITLLRSAVWKYAAAPHLNESSEPASDTAAWVRLISNCPEGLIDLVNSRACRSAIMFNDELSLDECRELVQKLCKCVFPFMCAHGRPSMVPLVDLGAIDTEQSLPGLGLNTPNETESKGGYAAAWKQWQAKETTAI